MEFLTLTKFFGILDIYTKMIFKTPYKKNCDVLLSVRKTNNYLDEWATNEFVIRLKLDY